LAKTLLVEGEIHWGYSIRAVSESAAAHPYTVPPPSTLMGALAFGIAQLHLRKPECLYEDGKLYSFTVKVFDHTLWATMSLGGSSLVTPSSDMIKMFSLIYQRGERHKLEYWEKGMWFGVRGHGKMYNPNGNFKILYVINDRLIDEIGSEQNLIKAAYQISRLGSKESIVNINSALLSTKLEVMRDKRPLRTSFYFPTELAEDVADAVIVTLPKTLKSSFIISPREALSLSLHENYYLPALQLGYLRPREAIVRKLSKNGVAFRASFEDREILFIAPKSLAEKLGGV